MSVGASTVMALCLLMGRPMGLMDTPAEASGETSSAGVYIRDVPAILGRHKRIVFGVPLALVGAALIYILLATPNYTATAQIYVDPRDRHFSRESGLADTVAGEGSLLLVESQIKIITSDEVLSRVIDKANLEHDSEFNGERKSIFSVLRALLGAKPVDRRLTTLRNLRLKTAAKRIDRSFVIDVMATADTADRSAQIANALADAYMEEQAGANAKFSRRASEAMSSRLESLGNAVRQAEDAVANYRAENNLIGARGRPITEQQLDETNTQLSEARAKLAEAQSRLALVEGAIRKGGALDGIPEAIRSPTILQLRTRAADISREETQLSQQFGPYHPALKSARAQKRDIERSINAELVRIAQSVRNDAARERADVETLKANLDALKKQSQSNETSMVTLRELERKAESTRAVYETFLANSKATFEQQVVDTNNIRLITEATPPEHKSWPSVPILLGASSFGGLAIGVAGALLRDSGEPSPVAPRSGREFESLMKRSRRRSADQLAALTDELAAAPAGHVTVLMQAEPDSAPSIELAALDVAKRIAEKGREVLLIDADFVNRRLTNLLGLRTRKGLREVLSAAAKVSEVCQFNETEKICVMPAGRARLHEPDRLSRAMMAALDGTRRFECVIIDAGLLGEQREIVDFFRDADDVVLLAASDCAEKDSVAAAVDALRDLHLNARALFVDPATLARSA